MFLVILGTFVAVIIVLLLNWCLVLYNNRSLNTIPGIWPYPYFGSIFPKDPFEFYQIILDLYKKYGSKFSVYTGPDLTIVFSRYQDIEVILSSNIHIDKSINYKFVKPWVGEGLLTSTGNKWKARRKLITPAFHFKILEKFMTSFNVAGRELVKQLDKVVGKKSVDVFEIVNFYTLDIICDTAMGVKIHAQTERNHPFAQSVKTFLALFVHRMFNLPAYFDWSFKFTSVYPEYVSSLNILQDLTTKVIKGRKEEMYKSENGKMGFNDNVTEKRTYALLDLLLTTKDADAEKLTDRDLRDEINTFMFEGHDTTTSSLAFTLLEIARHPEIQEKLYQAIISRFGTEMKDLSISDLNELKYLDMVVKESLRMYPSVPLIQRKLVEDMWIDGLKYPKGVTITLAIYLLHYDPELYPDPHQFDPERFSPENSVGRPSYAYVPFSAGPRNCIGQKFALYELKSAIIKILQNFTLFPVPGYQEELGIMATLKPKSGVHIRLEWREKSLQPAHRKDYGYPSIELKGFQVNIVQLLKNTGSKTPSSTPISASNS